jgi:beta-lactamase class A
LLDLLGGNPRGFNEINKIVSRAGRNICQSYLVLGDDFMKKRFFVLSIVSISLCGAFVINLHHSKSQIQITKKDGEQKQNNNIEQKYESNIDPKNKDNIEEKHENYIVQESEESVKVIDEDITHLEEGKIHNREDYNPKLLELEPVLRDMLKDKTGEYYIGIKDLKNSEELYINEKNKMLPAASVIKIYIMIEYFNQVKDKKIEQNKELDALVEAMIQKSDNYATNALIDKLGMDSINKTISKLGCKNTILNRKMLDFKSRLDGKDNFTSVQDISMALEKIYSEKCIYPDFDKKMISIMKGQKRRGKIPALLPDDVVIANKTGELPVDEQNKLLGVENDVAIVFTKDKDYIICVLFNGLYSTKQAVYTAQKLSKSIYDFMISN